MDAAVLGPQQAVPPPEPAPAKKVAAAPGSLPKPRGTAAGGGGRRKTLYDITNLSSRAPAEEPDEPACADGGIAQLVKARSPIHRNRRILLPQPLLICFLPDLHVCFFLLTEYMSVFQENADLSRLLEERK